jgi:hypothetical protein
MLNYIKIKGEFDKNEQKKQDAKSKSRRSMGKK